MLNNNFLTLINILFAKIFLKIKIRDAFIVNFSEKVGEFSETVFILIPLPGGFSCD
jgi:hypothetical protein